MSNLHKLYIYTNFFHFYIFHSNRIAARNETPYTFSYLYGNFCSAKLHGYIVARCDSCATLQHDARLTEEISSQSFRHESGVQ